MTDETPQIGGNIRQLRRQRGLSQASLARDLGISSSYLNLLEHNRRKLTVPLLIKLAQKFGIEITDLTANDESRLSGDLLELFSDDVFGDLDITNHDIREFTNSSPTVAKAVIHLHDEFRRLSDAPERSTNDGASAPLASEQVSDFLQSKGNYFEELERIASRVQSDLTGTPVSFEALSNYLTNVFGITVRVAEIKTGKNAAYDAASSMLTISDILPPESRNFALANAIARQAGETEVTETVEAANLSHQTVEDLALSALYSHIAGAILMPYSAFLRAAESHRYDIERLSLQFAVSFEQVCHRLTTLQRPGESGIPFHLIRTDIAGNISKRFSMSGIQIPRHGGACPRWNVYEAFLQPNRITIQTSQMPDGRKFFCIARTLTKGDNRHNATLRHMSIGLGCEMSQAHNLIYARGIDLSDDAKLTPVGVSCRTCPRENCSARAYPGLVET